MTEKTDADAMDLLVKMVSDEDTDNVGKSDSFDLDLDMSEFVAESRVESIIVSNVKNDSEKLVIEEKEEANVVGLEINTGDKINSEMSTESSVMNPMVSETESTRSLTVETEKLTTESGRVPASEAVQSIEDQSKSTDTHNRDQECNTMNFDSNYNKMIDKKHKCLACYFCPNNLNPKLRQFTRLEQKIINHIVEYRDLVLNQPIIILKRCDKMAKNASSTTMKSHTGFEKPAIVRENGLEEKKKHLDKELRAKMQKMAAEKAKVKELDAQKSLYSKLLKKQTPVHAKSSSADNTAAKPHSVSKPDTKTLSSNISTLNAKPDFKSTKVDEHKSKLNPMTKSNVLHRSSVKPDTQTVPLMSISFNNNSDNSVKKPDAADASAEKEGANEATSNDQNKDLNSFKIKKLDKKNFPRKTTNYISPLDQILYESNRFQTAAKLSNKITPANNVRKRPLNEKIVGGNSTDREIKKSRIPDNAADNGGMNKSSENWSRLFEAENNQRPPLLDRSPPPCAADFDSSPSPSYSSANADLAAMPFRGSNSYSRLDSLETMSKAIVTGKSIFPDHARVEIQYTYGNSPYENGKQARHSSMDRLPGTTWSSGPQEDVFIPISNGRQESKKGLLDRDFEERAQDTSLMSLFQQAGSFPTAEQDNRHAVEEIKMPETLESFLDDIVRKRKSGLLGDEFIVKEMAPRQSLLGASPLDFTNVGSDKHDVRRPSLEEGFLGRAKSPPVSVAPSRPVLLPNTDPYTLVASSTAKSEQVRPLSSLSTSVSQNDSSVNIAAMRKYPMLEDFIKPTTFDDNSGDAPRRTTLLPDVFPSTSTASTNYSSSSYPVLDRQINKMSSNDHVMPNLDVKQLLSGQASSSASLRMSDAESYFMSNISTSDLSSILKQLEKEEQKIRQDQAKQAGTPREVDIAKLFGQGMTQTFHDTADDEDDVEIPMPNASSFNSRSMDDSYSHPPASSSSILAQNSAVDKWADEMLEKLQRSQNIGRVDDSLNEILTKITSNRNKETTPSNLPNVPNSASKDFHANLPTSNDDDSSIHKTLGALRLLLDAGGDRDSSKNVDNYRKDTTPPPSTSIHHSDYDKPRPRHDPHFDRYRLFNEIDEILGSKDEFLINHFIRTLQQELTGLRPSGKQPAASDELLQITAVFDTMLCEPMSILNRDARRRREVERILPLLRAVGNLASEQLQNVVLTPVMLYLQDLIEKSLT